MPSPLLLHSCPREKKAKYVERNKSLTLLAIDERVSLSDARGKGNGRSTDPQRDDAHT